MQCSHGVVSDVAGMGKRITQIPTAGIRIMIVTSVEEKATPGTCARVKTKTGNETGETRTEMYRKETQCKR